MFNLFRSNAKIMRYLLGGLLVLVAVSMVTYLIPGTGMTSSTGSNVDNIVAEVGSQTVTAEEVKASVDRLVASGQLPRDTVSVYLPQMADQMIQDRAVLYAFERIGLKVTDEEVLAGLMSLYPQLFKDGKLTSTDQLARLLESQQRLTLADGVEAMRRQLLLRKVQNLAYSTVVVTPQEVDQAIVRKHQTAKIEYIAFPPAKFRDQVKPTPEQLRKQFEANRAQYLLPEKQSFQVLVADQAKMAQTMAITDAQLRSAYSSSMDSFRFPERVKARHILLMTQGKSDAEKKAALSKAQDLLKQVKGGADFAELAKKNSQDPGSAQNGGDLGFIVRGQTVPEFEKFAFSAKPKEISGIVTTEYGYHIIQALEKEPARVKPFEEVKGSIEEQLKKQGVNEKMQAAADQARAALQKAPGSAAEVAKQLGLELFTVTKADAGQPIPALGPSPEIAGTLTNMKPNDVSESLVLSGNRMAVVVLTEKIPPRAAEYSDVEGKVRDQFISITSLGLANDAANKAAEQIRGGADLDKVAKSFRLDVTKSTDFTTNDSVEGLGPAAPLIEAFSKPVGTVVGPIAVQNRNIVYKIVGQQTADPKNYAYERDVAVQELKGQKGRTMYDLFEDSMLNQARSDGKLKIHQDTLRQLATGYTQSR
jgi:peptidyl-prolyl cis-trans isomerase D